MTISANQEVIQPSGKPVSPAVKNGFKDKQLEEALSYLRSQIKLVQQSGTLKKAG